MITETSPGSDQSSKPRALLRLGGDPYLLPLLLLAVADAAVFAASLWLAYPIRFHLPLITWIPLPEGWSPPPFGDFFRFGLLAAIVGVVVFERLGFYQARIGTDRRVHVIRIILGVFLANLILQGVLTLNETSLSRVTRAIAFLMTIPLAVVAHYFLKHAHFRMVREGIGYRRALLVAGNVDEVPNTLQEIREIYGTEFEVAGVLEGNDGKMWEDQKDTWPNDRPPLLGNLSDLRRELASQRYDTVLLCMPGDSRDQANTAIRLCELFHVEFLINPDLFEKLLEDSPVGGDLFLPVLTTRDTPLSGSSLVLKRLFDLVGSSILILVCAPFWLLLSLLIKIESRGPVFYTQERLGHDGRTFRILKLRSMRADAEQEGQPVWASHDDPRTTRIGGWMRRWNVDETPQFINVFRGEMSLVGPRPERPYFVDQFKDIVPSYLRRHLVKSGVTGWAQINGLRGDTSIEERTRYDMWYIENWSLPLDLKILLKTLLLREPKDPTPDAGNC